MAYINLSRVDWNGAPAPYRGRQEKMTAKSLIVGFNFVFANPIILGTITLDLFAVLLGGATALLPIYSKDILHAGPYRVGPLGRLRCQPVRYFVL